MAVEQTLQLGDPVAIVGGLGVTESGEITISPTLPKGKGMISNDASFAPSLKESAGGGGGGGGGGDAADVRVIPLGKHKKARNYAGKQW